MYDLTAFQRDIMFVVAGMDDDPHGLGIKENLEAYRRESVNHGRLYPNLDELTEAGYLSKGEQDGRTNAYRITEDGREVMQKRVDWQTERLEVTA